MLMSAPSKNFCWRLARGAWPAGLASSGASRRSCRKEFNEINIDVIEYSVMSRSTVPQDLLSANHSPSGDAGGELNPHAGL